MRCPACNGNLYTSTFHSVEVDVCSLCNGIWFDDGELTLAANELISKDSIKPTGNQDLFKKRNIEKPDAKEGYRTCPKCTVLLKKTNFAYDSNIFVDQCDKCHGIWTDNGEIKHIAGFLKSDPQTQELGKALLQREQEQNDLKELAQASRSRKWHLYSPTFFMPLADDNPADRKPAVTCGIIAMCLVVFAMGLFYRQAIQNFCYLPSQPLSIKAFTSIFLHGDILHLAFNMVFLWVFGKTIESKLGELKFLTFFFGTGYIACITHSILSSDLSIPVIGASGAISGIMGAYLAFFPKSRLKLFWMGHTIHLSAYLFLITWFLFQMLNGLIFIDTNFSDTAWFSHVGGFTAGYFAARMIDSKQK